MTKATTNATTNATSNIAEMLFNLSVTEFISLPDSESGKNKVHSLTVSCDSLLESQKGIFGDFSIDFSFNGKVVYQVLFSNLIVSRLSRLDKQRKISTDTLLGFCQKLFGKVQSGEFPDKQLLTGLALLTGEESLISGAVIAKMIISREVFKQVFEQYAQKLNDEGIPLEKYFSQVVRYAKTL
jgi:hypothetical protein